MTRFPAPSPPYVGPPARWSGGSNKPINRVVIHSTVSPCQPGGARDIAAYFRSAAARGSAHYVVDPAEVVQVGFDSLICWHAPPNAHSIGVEMCDFPATGITGMRRWDDANHQAMLTRTAHLVAQLCLAYDVPIHRRYAIGLRLGRRGITGHVSVGRAFHQTTHWDPGAFPWRKFMRLVRTAAAAIERNHK